MNEDTGDKHTVGEQKWTKRKGRKPQGPKKKVDKEQGAKTAGDERTGDEVERGRTRGLPLDAKSGPSRGLDLNPFSRIRISEKLLRP